MKSLIDSAFLYDVLAHHVHAGHFDLVSSSFSTPGIARNMPSTTFLGIPSPTVGSPAAHTTSSVAGAESPSSSPSSSTIPSPGTLGAEAPAASGPATGGNTGQSTQFIILPDVWEDMVEPGSKPTPRGVSQSPYSISTLPRSPHLTSAVGFWRSARITNHIVFTNVSSILKYPRPSDAY